MGKRRNPLDDQGIFISIIVWNQTHSLKFQLGIKGLRPKIASSHLCPYLPEMRGIHDPAEKPGPDAFSSILGMNRNRDHMPFLREDDISQDFFSHAIGIAAHQEGIGMKQVELQKSSPTVRRFGKGMAFDLEDGI